MAGFIDLVGTTWFAGSAYRAKHSSFLAESVSAGPLSLAGGLFAIEPAPLGATMAGLGTGKGLVQTDTSRLWLGSADVWLSVVLGL